MCVTACFSSMGVGWCLWGESLALFASPLETRRHNHIGRLNNKRVYGTWRKQSTALHETAIRVPACHSRAALNISSHLVMLQTMREGQRKRESQTQWPKKCLSLKGIVHPKNENYVVIYSPSCCSKLVWISFFCWTQNKIFRNKIVTVPHWLKCYMTLWLF